MDFRFEQKQLKPIIRNGEEYHIPFAPGPLHSYCRYEKFVKSYKNKPNERRCFTLKNIRDKTKSNFFKTDRPNINSLTLIENNFKTDYVYFYNDLKKEKLSTNILQSKKKKLLTEIKWNQNELLDSDGYPFSVKLYIPTQKIFF